MPFCMEMEKSSPMKDGLVCWQEIGLHIDEKEYVGGEYPWRDMVPWNVLAGLEILIGRMVSFQGPGLSWSPECSLCSHGCCGEAKQR